MGLRRQRPALERPELTSTGNDVAPQGQRQEHGNAARQTQLQEAVALEEASPLSGMPWDQAPMFGLEEEESADVAPIQAEAPTHDDNGGPPSEPPPPPTTPDDTASAPSAPSTPGGGGGGGAAAAPGGGGGPPAGDAPAQPAAISGATVLEHADAFVAAPPSSQAVNQPELGSALSRLLGEEELSFQETVPDFTATLTGELEPVAVDGVAGPQAQAEAPLPDAPPPERAALPTSTQPAPFTANDNAASAVRGVAAESPEQLSGAISTGLSRIQTSDGNIAVSPGPAPRIPLVDGSDPARMSEGAQEAALQASTALGEARQAVLDAPGAERVQPLEVEETFAAEGFAAAGELSMSANPEMAEFVAYGLSQPVTAAFDVDVGPDFQASLADPQAQLRDASSARDTERTTALDQAQSDIDTQQQEAQASQAQEVIQQRQAIEAERSRTLQAQQGAVEGVRADISREQASHRSQVDARVQADQAQIEGRFQQAEQQAEAEVRSGEQRAEQERQRAERDAQDRSWWEKAVDWVADALRAVAELVSGIFDAVRQVVAGLLDAARAFANQIIDAAAAFLCTLIEAFGTLVKGLITNLLGTLFPELAAELCELVDGIVDTAQQAVQLVADGLKAAVSLIVDGLKGALDRILEIFQTAVTGALAVMAAVVTGDWSQAAMLLLETILKMAGVDMAFFTQIFGAAEAVLDFIISNADAIIEILCSLLLCVVNPAMIPVVLLGWAWRILPDELKGPIIDFILDAVIAVVSAIPDLLLMGPLWAAFKPGVVGFLQTVRARSTDDKVAISNKFAKIISGASPAFIFGFVKGFLRGVWEGVTDPFVMAWMLLNGLGSLGGWFTDMAANTSLSQVAEWASGLWGAISGKVSEIAEGFMPAVREMFSGDNMSIDGLISFMGEAWGQIQAAIAGAGATLATELCNFFLQDSAEGAMGEGVGWLTGTIIFEVILFYFTAGAGTAIVEGSRILKWILKALDWTGEVLGMAFKMIGKLGGLVVDMAKGLGRAVSSAGSGALKGLLAALGEVGETLLRWGDELLGMFSRSGDEVVGAGVRTTGSDVMEEGLEQTARGTTERTLTETTESVVETGAERTVVESTESVVETGAQSTVRSSADATPFRSGDVDLTTHVATDAERAGFRSGFDPDRYDEGLDFLQDMRRNHPELDHIPDEDLIALRGYTSNDYGALNGPLRTQNVDDLDEVGDYVRTASSGLNQLPATPGVSYRGTSMPDEILDTYTPGNVVTERAFTSTAAVPDAAFGGQVRMTVEGTSGRNVSMLSEFPDEAEILYAPGTRFEVVSRSTDPTTGQINIVMREVPPERVPGTIPTPTTTRPATSTTGEVTEAAAERPAREVGQESTEATTEAGGRQLDEAPDMTEKLRVAALAKVTSDALERQGMPVSAIVRTLESIYKPQYRWIKRFEWQLERGRMLVYMIASRLLVDEVLQQAGISIDSDGRYTVDSPKQAQALRDNPPSRPTDLADADVELWDDYMSYWEKRCDSMDSQFGKHGELRDSPPFTFERYKQARDDFSFSAPGKEFQDEFAGHMETTTGRPHDIDLGMKKGNGTTKYGDVVGQNENRVGRPTLDSHSVKRHDWQHIDMSDPAALRKVKGTVGADVREALSKYGGSIEVRRKGHPLYGQKTTVQTVQLVYDSRLISPALQAQISQWAQQAASRYRKTIRIEMQFFP